MVTPAISASSLQKADASRSFLEQHYLSMLRDLTSTGEARPTNRPREKKLTGNDFKLLKLIGRGAFGEVFICTKVDEPSQKLSVMKRMRKADMLKKKQVFHVRSERCGSIGPDVEVRGLNSAESAAVAAKLLTPFGASPMKGLIERQNGMSRGSGKNQRKRRNLPPICGSRNCVTNCDVLQQQI